MIFTIGTSNRSLDEFLRELENRRITQLVDVRSSPYSRLPWFNAPRIELWAQQAGIMYRQEGRTLGGRSAEEVGSSLYRRALERLLQSATAENVAIFCAEGAPEQCHRCYDVGASLLAFYGVSSINILRDGRDEEMSSTLGRVPWTSFSPEILAVLSSLC